MNIRLISAMNETPEETSLNDVAPETLQTLTEMFWPRNIRMLENTVIRSMLMHDAHETCLIQVSASEERAVMPPVFAELVARE